jgi:hypothetical protein
MMRKKAEVEITIDVFEFRVLSQKKPVPAWFWSCPCDDCERRCTIHGPFKTKALAEEHAHTTIQSYALEAVPETVCH